MYVNFKFLQSNKSYIYVLDAQNINLNPIMT